MSTPTSEKDFKDVAPVGITSAHEQKVYSASIASRENARFGSTSIAHRRFEPYHINVSVPCCSSAVNVTQTLTRLPEIPLVAAPLSTPSRLRSRPKTPLCTPCVEILYKH